MTKDTGTAHVMTADEARVAARKFASQHGIELSESEWAYVDTALSDHEARMRGEGSAVPVEADRG